MTFKLKKLLQILNAQGFSFPMIYIMSGYEKADFFVIFDIRALKWFQKSLADQRVQKVPKIVLKQSKTKVTVYI